MTVSCQSTDVGGSSMTAEAVDRDQNAHVADVGTFPVNPGSRCGRNYGAVVGRVVAARGMLRLNGPIAAPDGGRSGISKGTLRTRSPG